MDQALKRQAPNEGVTEIASMPNRGNAQRFG
jgi:hypothetical protein